MPNPYPIPPKLITPAELPALELVLPLCCKVCSHVGKYRVGRVGIAPGYLQEIRLWFLSKGRKKSSQGFTSIDWEKWVSFTGYFVCEQCGAGDRKSVV